MKMVQKGIYIYYMLACYLDLKKQRTCTKQKINKQIDKMNK